METSELARHGIELILRTRQGSRRELLQALEGFREKASVGPDSCNCELFEDLAEPNRFLWLEWWSSAEELGNATASRRFRAMVGAIRLLGNMESCRRVVRGDTDDSLDRSPAGRLSDPVGSKSN